jgi:hypothetical protein
MSIGFCSVLTGQDVLDELRVNVGEEFEFL